MRFVQGERWWHLGLGWGAGVNLGKSFGRESQQDLNIVGISACIILAVKSVGLERGAYMWYFWPEQPDEPCC